MQGEEFCQGDQWGLRLSSRRHEFPGVSPSPAALEQRTALFTQLGSRLLPPTEHYSSGSLWNQRKAILFNVVSGQSTDIETCWEGSGLTERKCLLRTSSFINKCQRGLTRLGSEPKLNVAPFLLCTRLWEMIIMPVKSQEVGSRCWLVVVEQSSL